MRFVSALAWLLGACSALPENSDGVATLEVRLPVNFFLELDRALTLKAVARNAAGDSVGAVLAWRTPDTTIAVDSALGTVTAKYPSGKGRVQVAVVGSKPLATGLENLLFTLTAAADSLDLTAPDSLDALNDATGVQITGLTLLGGTPLAPVPGRPVSFRITDPAPADTPTVVLTSRVSQRVADSSSTDLHGVAAAMLVVGAVNQTPPDRVVVEVIAYRASGERIPGSGRQIVIRFRHQ